MHFLMWIVAFCRFVHDHAADVGIAMALVTLTARAVYTLLAVILRPFPRIRAAVEAVASVSPDVWRFVVKGFNLLTGRDLPTMPLTSSAASSRSYRGDADAMLARMESLERENARLVAQIQSIQSGGEVVLSAPPAATPRPIGPSGFTAMVGVLAIGTMVTIAVTESCSSARNGLADITPTVPMRAVGVVDGTQLCDAGVPLSCREYDNVVRCYPLAALNADGGPARCAHRCVVDGEPLAAHCAAE